MERIKTIIPDHIRRQRLQRPFSEKTNLISHGGMFLAELSHYSIEQVFVVLVAPTFFY